MSAARAESLHRFLANLASSKTEQRRILHFYFSPDQRRLVLEQLLKGMSAEDRVILGCPRDAIDFYRSIFVHHATVPQITYVPVTEDWHRSVCNLLEEALRRTGRRVVLLADFDGLVKPGEVEGLSQWLQSGLHDSRITSIAQFSGRAFSETLLRRPLRKSALLLFDGFYCMPARSTSDTGIESPRAFSDDPELDLARE
jgi:hypothetical protein